MQPSHKSTQNSTQDLEHFEMICIETSSGPRHRVPRSAPGQSALSAMPVRETQQNCRRAAHTRCLREARSPRIPLWKDVQNSALWHRLRQWGPLTRLSKRSWHTSVTALISSMACTGILLLTESLDGSKLFPADQAAAGVLSSRQGQTSARSLTRAEAFTAGAPSLSNATRLGVQSPGENEFTPQERALVPHPFGTVLQVQAALDAPSPQENADIPATQDSTIKPEGFPLLMGKRSVEVPLKAEAGGLWVDVRLNDQVTHTMLIDTGASVVILPGKLAILLGIHDSGVERELRTIQGSLKGRLVTLNSVKLGGAQASGVAAVVVPGDDPKVIGLLGRSFLSQFSFGVDLDRNTLILRPRQPLARHGEPRPVAIPALFKGPSAARAAHQFALQALPTDALPTQLD